eukprot:scaffold243200_cov66-Cyclotella_meneghiniana.AAC.5
MLHSDVEQGKASNEYTVSCRGAPEVRVELEEQYRMVDCRVDGDAVESGCKQTSVESRAEDLLNGHVSEWPIDNLCNIV